MTGKRLTYEMLWNLANLRTATLLPLLGEHLTFGQCLSNLSVRVVSNRKDLIAHDRKLFVDSQPGTQRLCRDLSANCVVKYNVVCTAMHTACPVFCTWHDVSKWSC